MNVKTNKIKLLWLGVLAGVLGIISKLVYRPLVIEYNIQDFGISDCLPNFFAAFSLYLLTAFLMSKGQLKSMIAVCGGILIYELEQIWTSMIFDYLDILATLFGLVFSILIFLETNSLKVDNYNKPFGNKVVLMIVKEDIITT